MRLRFALNIILLFSLALPPALYAEGKTDSEFYGIHGQATFLPQWHPAFTAPYSGANSLNTAPELDASFTCSLYLAVMLWEGGYFSLTPQLLGGRGFSDLSGVADFPNGDISRSDDGNLHYDQAEAYYQQVFGLGGETENIEPEAGQLAAQRDISRITLTAGKFILTDFMDSNTYAHDARTQFINLGLVDNAAWDYAANVYGDTWAVMAELNQKDWALRLCSAMVADTAIGENFDGNLVQARGDNAEFEWRYGDESNPGKILALGFLNHAHMGSYQEALQLSPGQPDITQTRAYREKVGFGLSWEQDFHKVFGLFARLGLNDGQSESWAQTSADQSLSFGGTVQGSQWGRSDDQMGLGIVVSGLSAIHQAYLDGGGYDFAIGDGRLNYAPEGVAELYYLYKPDSWLGLTLDFQCVVDPAFNQDRGPVFVSSGRVHIED